MKPAAVLVDSWDKMIRQLDEQRREGSCGSQRMWAKKEALVHSPIPLDSARETLTRYPQDETSVLGGFMV